MENLTFYELSKELRIEKVHQIYQKIDESVFKGEYSQLKNYCDHSDTYIRKAFYECIGKFYFRNPDYLPQLLSMIDWMLKAESFRIRQTAINAAGEIGKKDFESVAYIFSLSLFDEHHSPRNAVIGSIKKMGKVNPEPVLNWAKQFLHHPDKEIRREICHGIELRGRTHPEDILPLLKELQNDPTKRVYNTLVHVIGQIAYKKGCLEKVLKEIKHWENKTLVKDAVDEIIHVHKRYANFSFYSQEEAITIIKNWKQYD